MRRLSHGFTLVELLAVVAITGILTSLLVPALTQTRSRAVASRCLNNMRQIGLASSIYIEDNEGKIPQPTPNRHWIDLLDPKLAGSGIYHCTLDGSVTNRVTSYAMNDFVTAAATAAGKDFTRIGNIPSATDTMHVGESADNYAGGPAFRFTATEPMEPGGHSPEAFEAQVAVERHSRSANYLFLDGHISPLRWRIVQQMLTRPSSTFVNPDGYNRKTSSEATFR